MFQTKAPSKRRGFYFWSMNVPPYLKPGDKVAVVNPAKRLQSDIEAGLQQLRDWGLEPVLGKYVREEHNLFAGDDTQRQEDLQWALNDVDIKAILIARGGYGTTRILDEVLFTGLQENPKWICGFSDITTLLCKLDNLGIASIHGPMLASMGRDDFSDQSLRSLFFGESVAYEAKPRRENVLGSAQAEVIGGNVTMICNSIGTASEIQTSGKILFLEEVGEYIYHLDRMLVHLLRAGKLSALAGIIIGDFSNMKDHNDTFGMSTSDVLRSHLNHLGCPVAYGFPAGHEHKNLPLPFGIPVHLEVSKEHTRLTIPR